MNIQVMIIDGQADFRTLLMHHVTTHWPDAVITAYDPTAGGYLPEEFSGAGNDVILLGDELGERKGLDILQQFLRRPNFPAIIYFGQTDSDVMAAKQAGADDALPRTDIRHDALVVKIGDALRARRRSAATGALFVGDAKIGIPALIRGYRLIRKISYSAHSAVYLGEREATGEKVVLKVLQQVPDDADTDTVGAFDRFLQEYELIGEIDHPNIVKIFDLGVSDDHAHIVMEFIGGGNLKSRIATGLSEEQAVSYLRQIASALAAIHRVGILHRDLKPANVMLRKDDSIALIDFGLAKRMRLTMAITGSGEIFGTPYYMSPEQGHGGVADHRSDIYSLGVLFYEMLTGRKPYKADSAMGIIYLHAQGPLPVLPLELSKYQPLTDRMLAKKPEDRLQSVAEVEDWL